MTSCPVQQIAAKGAHFRAILTCENNEIVGLMGPAIKVDDGYGQ
jgi:hypothetical protein